MRIGLLFVVVAACGKDAPPPTPAPTSGSTDPFATRAAPTDSAPAGADAELDVYLNDFIAYGDKSVVMLAKFDGDCVALTKAMLALEPLAKSLRERGEAIETDPARAARLTELKTALKESVIAHYQELLKPLNMTMDDVGKKGQAMESSCAGNAAFEDAVQRVGLEKKH